MDLHLKQTLINKIDQLNQENFMGFIVAQDSNSAPRFNMRFNRIEVNDGGDEGDAFLVLYEEDDTKPGYWGQFSPFDVVGGGWHLYPHMVFPLADVVDVEIQNDRHYRCTMQLTLSSGEEESGASQDSYTKQQCRETTSRGAEFGTTGKRNREDT